MHTGRHTWLAQRDESSLNSCVSIGRGAHEKATVHLMMFLSYVLMTDKSVF